MTDAWIVGGALRDELLGRPVRDVDVAVSGDPKRAAGALAKDVRGPVFRLSLPWLRCAKLCAFLYRRKLSGQ